MQGHPPPSCAPQLIVLGDIELNQNSGIVQGKHSPAPALVAGTDAELALVAVSLQGNPSPVPSPQLIATGNIELKQDSVTMQGKPSPAPVPAVVATGDLEQAEDAVTLQGKE